MNNLLSFRVRWYKEVFLAFLRRYQHTLVIVLFALFPIAGNSDFLVGLLRLISSPLSHIYNQEISSYIRLLNLLAAQGIYVLWIVIQKDAVTGNPFTEYLMSYPIKKQDMWIVNLTIIISANNVMWLLLIAPLILTCITNNTFIFVASDIANIISLMCLVVLAQMLWLYRSVRIFLILAIINIFYIFITTSKAHIYFALSMIFMMSIIWGVIFFPRLFDGLLWLAISNNTINTISNNSIPTGKPSSINSIIKIYFKLLFSHHRFQVFNRFIFGFLISALCIFILHQSHLKISFSYFCMYISAVIFAASEVFSLLAAERNHILPYIKSLPIKTGFWCFLDSCTVFLMVFLISLPVFFYAYNEKMIDFLNIIEIIIFVLPLIFVLFYIRNIFEKQSATASIAVCILWSFTCFMISSTGKI